MNKGAISFLCLILTSCVNKSCVYDKEKDTDTYQTTVSKSKRSHKLTLKNGEIVSADITNIKNLARSFAQTGVKHITISPTIKSWPLSHAYADSIEKIRHILVDAGLNRSSIYVTEPIVGTDENIIIDSYIYTIALPTAKKWKYHVGDINPYKELPNMGVSHEYNLGSMIANPKDLIEPDEMIGANGKSSIVAVKKAMSGASSGSTSGSSSGSSSSGSTSSTSMK